MAARMNSSGSGCTSKGRSRIWSAVSGMVPLSFVDGCLAVGAPARRVARGLELSAADVVEIHVDAARRGLGGLVDDRLGTAHDGRVVAEFGHQPVRLLPGTGAADDPTGPEQPGDLAGHRADR